MTMPKEFYRTGNYNVNHSICGSKIYNHDFNGYTSMSDMVKRIVSDWEFDEDCKKNIESRDKNKNYKKGVK